MYKLIEKHEFNWWMWVSKMVLIINYIIDIFTMPFGFMFHFGTKFLNYMIKKQCDK